MKKLGTKLYVFLIFCFMIIGLFTSYAQDTIVLKDESEIIAKVLEVNEGLIKYKKWDNKDGPSYTIKKALVSKLKYENGTEEDLEEIESSHKKAKEKNSEEKNKKEAYRLPNIATLGIGYGGGWLLLGYEELHSGHTSYGGGVTSDEKSRLSPVISLGFEHVLRKKLRIGYLGVGARFCYQSMLWTATVQAPSLNVFYEYKLRWNIYDLSLRAVFHFILPKHPNIEPYAGLAPSYLIWKMKTTQNLNGDVYSEETSIGHIPEIASAFVGIRFRIFKVISLFAELGYPYSYATGGANLQF